MNIIRFSSVLVLALAATACSDDEDTNPTTGTASNQPAAGNGGGGNAGSANASAAGSSGAPTTSAAGSSAEGPDDDIDLQPGDGDDDNAGGDGDSDAPPPVAADAGAEVEGDAGGEDEDTSMSFFVTSVGGPDGGNFGGIEGADLLCTTLATAVSPELGAKTWRAYLSTSTENARDRIGAGPWRNANGVIIGTSVDQIHDQAPGGASEATYPLNNSAVPLDETGAEVPNNPVLHDIITGSNADGTVSASGTCSDWTSTTGTTRNGHSNRAGGGDSPSSWNSSHDTGCGADPGQNFADGTVTAGGGRGSIYCFAAD